MIRQALLLGLVLLLVGCSGGGGSRPSASGQVGADSTAASSGERYALSGDAYPQDPPDVSEVPNAEPRREPLSRGGNRSPYEVWGKSYEVLADASGYVREGKASWYGEKFHGYATSNGEIYDMYTMSAAHRSLPLPSFARVTSQNNGRSVIVRVNDRGPFHSEREIDLSYAAAARLDILDRGTGRVRVEAIDVDQWLTNKATTAQPQAPPASPVPASVEVGSAVPSTPSGNDVHDAEEGVFLQVAALGSAESAKALKTRLESELSQPVRVASVTGTHRVQVGPLSHVDQANPVRDQLRRAGFAQAFIVHSED
ncbi:septal ring lytic transglycosylase RlpA family protein [Halomonas sp. TRM85114]|uniref:septal ring lytic transglycosylase RlpA family protein n=1 Tax=Halomonas jincaotanensis TaxID=2810616 RepID=UPI001BD5718F|nr:septal ring lytic transglycosylase RlpA family protein [Halomonas jincaotanensis]MBS9404002.1 septal ring lytic transglycosylase RlpA family protein [Halomonas jincaotanensis]